MNILKQLEGKRTYLIAGLTLIYVLLGTVLGQEFNQELFVGAFLAITVGLKIDKKK